jgi:uncharacterized OsmC-like protein
MENNELELMVENALPGFDAAKLEAFCDFAEANPNEVLLGMRAKTYWEGSGGLSLAKVGPWQLAGQTISKPSRDYSIQFGAWKEVEDALGVIGAADRLEPVEAALAALCGCVTWAICINAAREGITFSTLNVTASVKVDPRVLLGVSPVEDSASCLENVDMEIQVEGDQLSATDKQAILNMAKRSPVRALITQANNINTRLV